MCTIKYITRTRNINVSQQSDEAQYLTNNGLLAQLNYETRPNAMMRFVLYNI